MDFTEDDSAAVTASFADTPDPRLREVMTGHVPLTTHVFVAGSPYLDSDAVSAVKQSLVCDFELVDDADRAAELGLPPRFRRAAFDLVIEREAT